MNLKTIRNMSNINLVVSNSSKIKGIVLVSMGRWKKMRIKIKLWIKVVCIANWKYFKSIATKVMFRLNCSRRNNPQISLILLTVSSISKLTITNQILYLSRRSITKPQHLHPLPQILNSQTPNPHKLTIPNNSQYHRIKAYQ